MWWVCRSLAVITYRVIAKELKILVIVLGRLWKGPVSYKQNMSTGSGPIHLYVTQVAYKLGCRSNN